MSVSLIRTTLLLSPNKSETILEELVAFDLAAAAAASGVCTHSLIALNNRGSKIGRELEQVVPCYSLLTTSGVQTSFQLPFPR